MADLTIGTIKTQSTLTRSNLDSKQVGEAVSVGDVVYLDSATSKRLKADASASASAAATHLCLTAADADGYSTMLVLDSTSGLQIDLGVTLTVGTTYVVSATAGKIAPEADLASTEHVTHLGVASTTALLDLNLNVSGIAKP